MILSILTKRNILTVLICFCFACLHTNANAQNTQTNIVKPETKSRIAVSITEEKTSVWISDFPKNTSVVLFDEEYNMLAITSTNDFGAGFTRLPIAYNSRIFAKTLNGEIVVAAIMPDKTEAKVARLELKNTVKS